MITVEGPFLAAIIARLPEPKINLAAHGVAFAFALLVEAPVIMIMSASTALVENRSSFQRLRAFTYGLNAAVTLAMVLLLVPPVFRFVSHAIITLPDEVARLSYWALWILLPWPAAIGYRRFYQGILIREGHTRLVAYGTVLRLSTMSTTGIVLFATLAPPGTFVAAAALSAAVCAEAVASRWMARSSVRRLLGTGGEGLQEPGRSLSFRRIVDFYYPLALTSLIALAVQPMLTFFMGRAPSPLESLAVFPVVVALSFVFRAAGLSFQEVAIALMGKQFERVRELGRFALWLGLAASTGLGVVALTPVADFWFETLSGLEPDLARFAILPTILLVPIPFFAVLGAFQRGILVVAHVTRPITVATVLEVIGIAIVFPVLGWKLGMIGVTAASVAFLVGRLLSFGYLIAPCLRVLRSAAQSSLVVPSRPESS